LYVVNEIDYPSGKLCPKFTSGAILVKILNIPYEKYSDIPNGHLLQLFFALSPVTNF